jgi:hypothetical protein
VSIPYTLATIFVRPPTVFLESDASDEGWGGIKRLDTFPFKETTNGSWFPEEIQMKNNYLELKGAMFTIFAFCKNMQNIHIRIASDNTTAVSYINKQGGKIRHLNVVARKLWKWAKFNDNWISAVHISGVENPEADFESRHINQSLESSLNEGIFQKICKNFGKPDIDLFASRTNRKLEKYVSFSFDPFAWKMDAFALDWTNLFVYSFPPVQMISKVVQKLKREKPRIILIVPDWPMQAWYTEVFSLTNDYFLFSGREVSNQVHMVNQYLALHIRF